MLQLQIVAAGSWWTIGRIGARICLKQIELQLARVRSLIIPDGLENACHAAAYSCDCETGLEAVAATASLTTCKFQSQGTEDQYRAGCAIAQKR